MENTKLYGKIKDTISANLAGYYREDKESINNDCLMTLDYDGTLCHLNQNHIQNSFHNDFKFIHGLLETSELDIENHFAIYDYIKNSELLNQSESLKLEYDKERYFNYCVSLCGRYLPNIIIDVNEILNEFKENFDNNEKLYVDGFYSKKVFSECINKYFLLNQNIKLNFNKSNFKYIGKNSNRKYTLEKNVIERKAFNSYFELKDSLFQEFCAYLLYWIRAYNLTIAIRDSHNQESNIAFSHRYKGWSQPSSGIGDLNIEFKTNFGFGNSSYFCVLLEYKDIKIVPFMDWVRYPYYEAYQILQYTKKVHELKSNGKYQSIFISDEHWQKAMKLLCEMINLYLDDEILFVQTYVINELDKMIDKLYNILNMSSKELNKEYAINENYRKINSEQLFNTVGNIEDLNFKASKICGALGFIDKIIELSAIVDGSNYIEKLKKCNLKILPILTKAVLESKSMVEKLQSEKTLNQNNLALIPKENIDEIIKLKDKINKASADISIINNLCRNIEKYILSINKYVNNQ